jgi:hypothetical protein
MIVWGKNLALGKMMFIISSFFAFWLLLRLFLKTRF